MTQPVDPSDNPADVLANLIGYQREAMGVDIFGPMRDHLDAPMPVEQEERPRFLDFRDLRPGGNPIRAWNRRRRSLIDRPLVRPTEPQIDHVDLTRNRTEGRSPVEEARISLMPRAFGIDWASEPDRTAISESYAAQSYGAMEARVLATMLGQPVVTAVQQSGIIGREAAEALTLDRFRSMRDSLGWRHLDDARVRPQHADINNPCAEMLPEDPSDDPVGREIGRLRSFGTVTGRTSSRDIYAEVAAYTERMDITAERERMMAAGMTRQQAREATLGAAYGMGTNRLAEQVARLGENLSQASITGIGEAMSRAFRGHSIDEFNFMPFRGREFDQQERVAIREIKRLIIPLVVEGRRPINLEEDDG